MKYIILITNLIVRNNGGAAARALMEMGYEKKYIENEELEKALLQLYLADPDKYFNLLISIPWNYGHIETNKPEIRDAILKAMNITDTIETKGEWWKALVNEVRKSESEKSDILLSKFEALKPYNFALKYFFYGIGAVLMIVLIIYLIKKIFSN